MRNASSALSAPHVSARMRRQGGMRRQPRMCRHGMRRKSASSGANASSVTNVTSRNVSSECVVRGNANASSVTNVSSGNVLSECVVSHGFGCVVKMRCQGGMRRQARTRRQGVRHQNASSGGNISRQSRMCRQGMCRQNASSGLVVCSASD